MTQSNIQTVITIAVVAVVFALRFRGMNRERRLKLELMWILPTLLVTAMVFALLQFPPHGLDWLWLGAIFAVGSAIGWWRGKLMRVAVDPETHELSQTVSPAALIFIVALIVIRSVSRAMAVQMAGPGPSGLMAATDILMAFALGFITFQRVEIFVRARRMLAEARARRL